MVGLGLRWETECADHGIEPGAHLVGIVSHDYWTRRFARDPHILGRTFRMDNILDTTRWGVAATNFCKNILLENCTLSRMDTHQGVSGTYTIRGCTIGYIGLNAIGRGTLLVENCSGVNSADGRINRPTSTSALAGSLRYVRSK